MTVLSKSIRRVPSAYAQCRRAAVGTPYDQINIGVPKESLAGENRVALTPEGVGKLRKMNFNIQVESGAGANASYSDAAYAEAGATIKDNVWDSDMILKGHTLNTLYPIKSLRYIKCPKNRFFRRM